jgi:heme oxygenase
MDRLPFEPPYQYRDGAARLPQGDLLRIMMSRDSTDARDRIYAVLGHPALWVGDLRDALVKADYTISVEELCERTMVGAVERKQDLSLLSLVQHGSKNPYTSGPSWVPNLKIEANVIGFLFIRI